MDEKKKNIHAVHLGRLGGRVKTPAKSQASRENGKKGGRPHRLRQKRTNGESPL